MRKRNVLAVAAAAVLGLVLSACGGASGASNEPEATTGSQQVALTVQADIVQGSANLTDEQKPVSSCVGQTRYAHNAQVVWRVRVTDPTTGEEMDDTSIESVEITLGDGQEFEAHFADHPKSNPTDSFWATSWTIPQDYPSGSVDWSVTATATDGRTGTFKPFNVAPSLLTVTDDVLPVASS